MSTTEKYDLDLTDYGLTGWNAILKGAIEALDEYLHTRILATLGETVAIGEALFLETDGKYWLAQAAAGMVPVRGIAMEVGNADDEVRIIRVGPLTVSGWVWSVGLPVYVDPSTPGALTQTKPTAFAQPIGLATATDTVFIWIEDLDPIHYGTSDPPTPTGYPDGTIYLKYTA